MTLQTALTFEHFAQEKAAQVRLTEDGIASLPSQLFRPVEPCIQYFLVLCSGQSNFCKHFELEITRMHFHVERRP